MQKSKSKNVMSNVPQADHEKIRIELRKELESVVKAAIASPHSSQEHVPSEITLNICNTIEAVFIHGLRDPFFLKGTRYAKYPEPNFWPFVSKYSHKSVSSQIVKLKQIKSEIGKSRAWIRIILNENTLDHYLNLLASEKSALGQFYEDHSFLRYLRDSEFAEQVLGIVRPLGKLSFCAATNSSFLNSWTPSPLILAGLLDGTPLRVGTLIPRRHMRADSVTEEIAVSALDLLMPDGDGTRPVKEYQGKRSRRNTYRHAESDDDRSSTYSHPSMVDFGDYPTSTRPSSTGKRPIPKMSSSNSFGHLPYPQSPLLTSTPLDSVILSAAMTKKSSAIDLPKESSEPSNDRFSPLIVTRRLHKPRKSSRSSSESNSLISADTPRQSRANSDMPSTIAGTVPDHSTIMETELFHVSDTMDSGIGNEKKSDPPKIVSVPFLQALTQVSQEASEKEAQALESLENALQEAHPILAVGQNELQEVPFSVESEPEVPLSSEQEPEVNPPLFNEMPTKAITFAARKSDSILGTSLHDELMNAMPSGPGQSSFDFEQNYCLPPAAMGNSIAAISKRSQMAWESMSDRSRMSSSSDSGPMMSFGQALRSAMETTPYDQLDNTDDFGLNDSDFADESSRKTTRCSAATEETISKLCELPKELGLDSQDFRCALCRKSIGGPTYAAFEKCAVDAMYYCNDCMCRSEKSVIPARVFANWDWSERAVSDKGRLWIDMNKEKALMNIETGSTKLYQHVPKLAAVLALRQKLQIGAMYLFTCRESVANDFRKKIQFKDYLHSDVHLYSFTDLQDVKSGAMEKRLKQLLAYTINHVMNCTLCKQKGFVCELCTVDQVIYPFQTETTHRCHLCFAVYHKTCFDEADACPKCERKAQFETRTAHDDPNMLILQQ